MIVTQTTSELTIVRGMGAELWDEANRRYIDCVGGQGSANLGHCHPAVVRAIQKQAERLLSCPTMFGNDAREALLRRLAGVTPPGLDRFFLCNSGTEAVEAAIKAARLATGRAGIVAAQRGFHGRTLGALAATWEPRYRAPFEPLPPGTRFVPYNDVAALEAAVDETVGLVLLEPVQGEGGVHPAAPGYLRAAAEIAHTRGALLALDEVQTGFGRTGAMFACEADGVAPDLLCLAKSIAGGLPMGALAFGPSVESFPPGAHGSTFGGAPLVCAAATAAIGALVDEDLPAHAAATGAYLIERLRELDTPGVRAVRGRGLMIGIELRVKARPVVAALRERGVLALTAGLTVLRLLPPLVITREQCDEVVAAIDDALRESMVDRR
jgi:acetylornithine/LysW-gamma-L-lysine aminotransferase